MMKYKPILFNTEMVQAILDGRKTQTRRIVRLPDGIDPTRAEPSPDYEETLDVWDFMHGTNANGIFIDCFCPVKSPCAVGDILWVRETWTKEMRNYYYRADFESDWLDPCETLSGGYPASCVYHPGCEGCDRQMHRIYWHPSIHMPKEAARIFLKVTDVHPERLQDIDEDDVCREGAEGLILACEHMDYSFTPPEPCFNANPCHDCIINYGYPELFGKMVWNETIKPADLQRFGWDANPWVWVIEFERIDIPMGWCAK